MARVRATATWWTLLTIRKLCSALILSKNIWSNRHGCCRVSRGIHWQACSRIGKFQRSCNAYLPPAEQQANIVLHLTALTRQKTMLGFFA